MNHCSHCAKQEATELWKNLISAEGWFGTIQGDIEGGSYAGHSLAQGNGVGGKKFDQPAAALEKGGSD